VVGVPIAEVVNTLVQWPARWLRAMLVVWTPNDLLEVGVP
jgi:hypothetical protein